MNKVLVIEDNRDNLRLISYPLRRAGYEVITAEMGIKGVRLATTCEPLFIIVDIDLPDIDGLEVSWRIRKESRCDAIPLVAITSLAMVGDRERILAAGCNAYFEKPFDPITIVERIHKALGLGGPSL